MCSPHLRMSFTPAIETKPVEPAEPDPFTSRPNPLTGKFPARIPQSFPGPLQLPGSYPSAGSSAYGSTEISPVSSFQSTRHPLPQQVHESFSIIRPSGAPIDERRTPGLFPSNMETYSNPTTQRHDSAAGIKPETFDHPHYSSTPDRYMVVEPTPAVLHYSGHARQERDPPAYASGSGSSNDIQGATIMGYGTGGLIYIRKRRGNLPKEATNFLKKWFDDHQHNPYPTEEDKQRMVRQTGLETNQISNWFINARRRRKHNRSPEQSYHETMSRSPSPSSMVLDTPLDSPARPPPYQ